MVETRDCRICVDWSTIKLIKWCSYTIDGGCDAW